MTPLLLIAAQAAFLFAYDVDRGKEDAFEAGYAAHLEWHAAHGDTLPWYGWFVTSGPRVGVFVDGTFGIPFEAMDHRVDPAGDGADMTAKVLPFAKARTYSALELWPEGGVSRTLEERSPSAVLDVFTIRVAPAKVAAFEKIVTDAGRRTVVPAAWYRLVTGGPVGSYLVLVPRRNWADLSSRPRALPTEAAALTESVEVETWSYRSKLSRLP